MSSSHITYVPRDDATPEAGTSALAAIYRLVLDRKKAVPDRRPEDARERINDARTKSHST
jgi:hypothetical protein